MSPDEVGTAEPTPRALARSASAPAVVVAAQVLFAVAVVVVGIRAGLLLHDAVASSVRAGVSSGVGTLSWILFVPFSLLLGWLVRAYGVGWGGRRAPRYAGAVDHRRGRALNQAGANELVSCEQSSRAGRRLRR